MLHTTEHRCEIEYVPNDANTRMMGAEGDL